MGQTQVEPLLTTPSPTLVQRLVPDDSEQPGPEGSVITKSGEGPVSFDERLLGHVFGHAVVPYDQIGHTQGDLLMRPDQHLERRDIAILRSEDLLLLVQWAALHRLLGN
jgi:hypothetical protein